MKNTILKTALVLSMSATLALAEQTPVEPTVEMSTGATETMADTVSETKFNNVGLKAGTLGAGIEWSMPINEQFSVRFNFNGASYDEKEESDDVTYDGTLKLSNIGILGDYYPSESSFRLTAGAFINNNKFTGRALPTSLSPIDLGDSTYGINDIGHVDTEVTFQKVSPYIGIGFGNDTREKGWGFTLDIGAMYQGTPQADVTASIKNPLLAAVINKELEAEKRNLEEELSDFTIYPVVMIGVNYTF
jgi:hypothetical protein